ncbi:hypothetical protein BDU57DRAFT_290647 [Ampelomyces quisqualis]|uniref:Uncharacterized protein n=1 Tax=Ampelomyces quisqualis TaxID=50730 RepID=A0A6A5QHK7_AMPQU|nr:hypothetical protein BDU57DRAFT_290647 [Ampelomyces quisqualis]
MPSCRPNARRTAGDGASYEPGPHGLVQRRAWWESGSIRGVCVCGVDRARAVRAGGGRRVMWSVGGYVMYVLYLSKREKNTSPPRQRRPLSQRKKPPARWFYRVCLCGSVVGWKKFEACCDRGSTPGQTFPRSPAVRKTAVTCACDEAAMSCFDGCASFKAGESLC